MEKGGGGGERDMDEMLSPGDRRMHTQPSASDAASNKASWMPDLSGMRPRTKPKQHLFDYCMSQVILLYDLTTVWGLVSWMPDLSGMRPCSSPILMEGPRFVRGLPDVKQGCCLGLV